MPSARPAHRPSARDAMLEAAESEALQGNSLSLESVAKAAGVTKAGLMYHFATKQDLMTAVLDRVVDRCLDGLTEHLRAVAGHRDLAAASVRERLSAYLLWSCATEHDQGELVMFADPRLREQLTSRWIERFEPWVAVPDRLPSPERSRLLGVRLMADGLWFAGASNTLPLSRAQRTGVRKVGLALLEQDA